MPKISVIIPCYNCEKYVAKCLDSVLAQTFEDWEAIVVNDGSTDGSVEILNRYAAKDSRIKIVAQENQGLSMARNNGFKFAQGNYVSFLDSDDFIDENFLLDLHNQAVKEQADAVMTSTKYLCGTKIKKDMLHYDVLNSFIEKISSLPHGGCCNKLYRKDFLTSHNLQFPKGLYWEDNIFSLQVCYFSNKLAVIGGEHNSYNYESNPSGITRNPLKEEKRLKDSLIMSKMIMDFAKAHKFNLQEMEASSAFCLRNFVNAKNLLQDDFYKEISDVLGDSKLLRKLRRKAIFKSIRRKIVKIIKSIVTVKLEN